jgi:hypothetical protein
VPTPSQFWQTPRKRSFLFGSPQQTGQGSPYSVPALKISICPPQTMHTHFPLQTGHSVVPPGIPLCLLRRTWSWRIHRPSDAGHSPAAVFHKELGGYSKAAIIGSLRGRNSTPLRSRSRQTKRQSNAVRKLSNESLNSIGSRLNRSKRRPAPKAVKSRRLQG